MRIKVLVNLGAGLPRFRQDEIHEVTEQIGLMLIARHWAAPLPEDPVATAPITEPLAVDKYEAIRQHPDHVTKKPSTPRKRSPRTTEEIQSKGE